MLSIESEMEVPLLRLGDERILSKKKLHRKTTTLPAVTEDKLESLNRASVISLSDVIRSPGLDGSTL